ncbi:uridylate kinase [Moelleriella libera RCEF 2490]|uniref:Uridylate kinase n=1 Tax=Moelleriella libera RCEF 2490 TaxID=1081109 RepID=A0A166VL69_9HYPO|nr:uridylate kinase [Moelleriella libera RCEF 2490]
MASRIISLPWRPVAARATTPPAAAGVTRALLSSSSSSSATLSSASCRRTVAFHPPAPTRHNRRSYSSSSSSDKVKFWPFIAVIAVGTAGYIGLVNRRKEMPPPPRTTGAAAAAAAAADHQQQQQQPTSTTGDTAAAAAASPVFSPADTTVIFVLGGPGAGKGTQCANLVREYGFTHLSAGDLLRAEQDRPGSQFGDLIRDHIKNGLIVPMEVTIKLLENAMRESLDNNKKQQQSNNEKNSPVATTSAGAGSAGGGRFLIDGFPRKLDQAHKFEESVCAARMVLFFDCPEAVMEERLLERGKTSGRADDNADSIRKRFRTFVDTSMPVVEYYAAQAKVVKIDATPAPDHVFAATRACLAEKLGKDF